MRNQNTCLIAILSFILGSMLSINLINYDMCEIPQDVSKTGSSNPEKSSYQHVVLIFSKPDNSDKRKVIRDTWLKLKPSSDKHGSFSQKIKEWRHYFVVGILSATEKTKNSLKNEHSKFGDLLILPHLKDNYNTLSEKLLQSIKWVNENNPKLLYMLKCDDDSFVRIDLIIQELKVIRQQMLESSNGFVMYSAANGKFDKNQNLPTTGLYWGYFKGNAHIRLKGRWAEKEFFLCDRYLPYALGGGYVLSADIVEFIAKNSHFLQLYNSEDVSMGVWTASLSRLDRRHDIRFDTEWSSRGCDDKFLIQHKQSPTEMRKMHLSLFESNNKKLCNIPSVLRSSYEYNWAVPPSQCCKVVS